MDDVRIYNRVLTPNEIRALAGLPPIYTLTYVAGPGGSISGISPQTVNSGEDGTAVTAVPAAGYHFVKWSDDSTANPRTDTNITAALSVTASFAINTYTLTYTAGPGGTISGVTPQTVEYGGNGTEVIATSSIGYHFVSWSDGVLTAARTDTQVIADLTVAATFAQDEYTLTVTSPNGTVTKTPNQAIYHYGDVVQLRAMPSPGYAFDSWSGAATGNTNPVSIIMDGNKSVTAYLRGNTLGDPQGSLISWDHTFSWSGVAEAETYILQVKMENNTQVFYKSYTAAQAGCQGTTACSITVPELSNLPSGSYKWRIWDFGPYGTGVLSPYTTFSLNVPCYSLTTTVSRNGSGTVTATAQNCTGGYRPGTQVQLKAMPNPGYAFDSWSGAASGNSNPVSITMDDNKNVNAYLRGNTLGDPQGSLTSWNSTFSWSGVAEAETYILQVKMDNNTQVFYKSYTAAQAGCQGGTACSITVPELSNLANGNYKWRIWDFGPYGTGVLSPYTTFILNIPCYTLTTTVSRNGSGTVTATSQNCTGGYLPGTQVQLRATPSSGYAFDSWSGDASGKTNPVSITMDGSKTVNAYLRGNTLISPQGTLPTWNPTFSWSGVAEAETYILQVKMENNTQVFYKSYTAAQAGCQGATACSITIPELANLPSGSYKWRIWDFGPYGTGVLSPYTYFSY